MANAESGIKGSRQAWTLSRFIGSGGCIYPKLQISADLRVLGHLALSTQGRGRSIRALSGPLSSLICSTSVQLLGLGKNNGWLDSVASWHWGTIQFPRDGWSKSAGPETLQHAATDPTQTWKTVARQGSVSRHSSWLPESHCNDALFPDERKPCAVLTPKGWSWFI